MQWLSYIIGRLFCHFQICKLWSFMEFAVNVRYQHVHVVKIIQKHLLIRHAFLVQVHPQKKTNSFTKRLTNQAQCSCHLVRRLYASWLCIHGCQSWGGHPASLSLSMSQIWCSHVCFGQAMMKKVAEPSIDSLFTLHRGRQRDMMCQSLLSTWCICILQCWRDHEGTAWQDTGL